MSRQSGLLKEVVVVSIEVVLVVVDVVVVVNSVIEEQ